MEDNVKTYEFPDFGPDDDTEDMLGVSIYDPQTHKKKTDSNDKEKEINTDNSC